MTLNKIFTVRYGGIKARGDILIYSNLGKLILLSCYGSESHVKGIFANLGQNNEIEIITENKTFEVGRHWEAIRIKLFRIGYGKYHGVIYNPRLEDMLIIFPGETLQDAYNRFFNKRKVPILNEWIPDLHQLLIEKKFLIPYKTIGVQAYELYWGDEKICDFIVNNLKTFNTNAESLKKASNL